MSLEARAHLRAAGALAIAAALLATGVAGCGGARPARSGGGGGRGDEAARTTAAGGEDVYEGEAQSETLDAEMPVQPSATGAGGSGSAVRRRDRLVAVPRPEPTPWQAQEWAIAPAGPQRVLLATIELPPGDAFRPPTTSCQDVIVFVRAGQLEATGTGIAPSDAPATLYVGDAVRFGPEGDGIAVNVGEESARMVTAIARRPGAGPARFPASSSDDCAIGAGHDDPLRRPLRISSVATTPPLLAAGGALEVRILLDPEGAGAEAGALSWLEGAPALAIPEHLHHGAAEILLVEDGEGTMRVGEREIHVRPGAAIYVPEDTLHSFRSSGARPLRAIQIYSPAGPEQRFR